MIDLDARRLTDALIKLEAACDAMPQVAETTRAEALGHLILGARANIYSTAPGAYRRSQELLRGLDTRNRASRNRASVTVLNTVSYAVYVEAGRDGMSLAQLQQLALLRKDPADPLSLGRSGVNWTVPGPIVTGAQVFALRRMQELFGEKVRAVMR